MSSKQTDFNKSFKNNELINIDRGLHGLSQFTKANIVFKSKVAKLLRTFEPYVQEYRDKIMDLEKEHGKTEKKNDKEVAVRKTLSEKEAKERGVYKEDDEGNYIPAENQALGQIQFSSEESRKLFEKEWENLAKDEVNIVLPCVLKTSNFKDIKGNEFEVPIQFQYDIEKIVEIDED